MSNEVAWYKSSYSGTEGGNCLEVAVSWRKSSYSDTEGGACLEVGYTWRKSSHSGTEGGACVEVATCPSTVHVRDSKNAEGPVIGVAPAPWADFVRYAAAIDPA